VVVSGQTQQLVRQQLVPAVALLVLQLLVLGVVLLEQKRLRQQLRLIQDVLPLQQSYQLRHQLQEEFQQLVKEFLYQPCQ
jgi:hypothetical protein